MRKSLFGALVASALLASQAAAQSANNGVGTGCVGSDADSKDLKARERICLRELGDHASRSGNVLSLKLDDGKVKELRNNPKACSNDDASICANYYLVGFYPPTGRYLVYATYYEGFECKLVSVHTGKATTFRNIPHFAPDGSTFFVS